MDSKQVLIILGSASDLSYGEKIFNTLKRFEVGAKLVVSSAHRAPNETVAYVSNAEESGYKVVIAVAGLAAHLPGVCAAHTTLPVIAVPVATGPLSGQDALYASVMMPSGIPVATVTVGEAGATNAAMLATSILSIADQSLRDKLVNARNEMREKIIQKNKEIDKEFE